MTRLRDSGLSIIPILALATAIYLALSACAPLPPRIQHSTVTRCDGREVRTWVRIEESAAPAFRCAELWKQRGASAPALALFLAALPVGCAIRHGTNDDGELWSVVVPLGSRDGGPILEHELGHTTGLVHPIPGLSIGHVCQPQ